MTQILIFIIGVAGGFLVAWVWLDKKNKKIRKESGRVEREVQTEREMWYGFSEFNEKMAALKKERKGKIMEEMRKPFDAAQGKGRMRTSAVADLLDISRATAFRYLEELEKEGLIEQVGAHGKDVEYRAK